MFVRKINENTTPLQISNISQHYEAQQVENLKPKGNIMEGISDMVKTETPGLLTSKNSHLILVFLISFCFFFWFGGLLYVKYIEKKSLTFNNTKNIRTITVIHLILFIAIYLCINQTIFTKNTLESFMDRELLIIILSLCLFMILYNYCVFNQMHYLFFIIPFVFCVLLSFSNTLGFILVGLNK